MAPMSSATASVSRKILAASGTRLPSEGHDADGEGDVGGHRDAPAVGAGAAGVERDEDRGRDDHAAQRGDDREGDGPEVAEVAVHDLALDLDARRGGRTPP